MKELLLRLKSSTPKFFRELRTIGLMLIAGATVIISQPVQLPSNLVEIAGYVLVAGSVLAAVAQVTVEDPKGLQKELREKKE